jgi:hypothetical protein
LIRQIYLVVLQNNAFRGLSFIEIDIHRLRSKGTVMNISPEHLAFVRMQVYINVLSSLAWHVNRLLRLLVLFISPAEDLLLGLFIDNLVFNLFALRWLLAGVEHLCLSPGVCFEIYKVSRGKVHVRDVPIRLGLGLVGLLILLRGLVFANIRQVLIDFLDLLPRQFAGQVTFELGTREDFTLICDTA